MLENVNQFYSIAPMMGKTDSYFCFLMSLINNNITIYTEMMHSEAIIRTNTLNDYQISRLLSFKYLFCLFSINSSTTEGSAKVDVSPSSA